jgi:hypothetical protein
LPPELELVVWAMPYAATSPPVPPELAAELELVVCAIPYAGTAVWPPPELLDPEPVLLHAAAAVSPSNTATAARPTLPSRWRSGSPQLGQVVSELLAWQAQLGQTMRVGGMKG